LPEGHTHPLLLVEDPLIALQTLAAAVRRRWGRDRLADATRIYIRTVANPQALTVAAKLPNFNVVGCNFADFVTRVQNGGKSARAIPEGVVPEQLGRPPIGTGLGLDRFDCGTDFIRDERLAAVEDKTLIIYDQRRLADLSGYSSLQLIPQRVLL